MIRFVVEDVYFGFVCVEGNILEESNLHLTISQELDSIIIWKKNIIEPERYNLKVKK